MMSKFAHPSSSVTSAFRKYIADPQKDDMHKSRSIPDEAAFEVLKKG